MIHQPFCWVGLICVFCGIVGVFTGLRSKRESRALMGSSAFIAGLMIAGAASVFPVMLRSTRAAEYSLSAYQMAAAGHGLAVALVWWPFALVFAVGYFWFIYKHYDGKVKPTEDTQVPY
jgi:cytochrome bd-type quinol oxidase subunit 2